jgi:hypothetical protein
MTEFAGNVQALQSIINREGRLNTNVVSAKFGTDLDAADNNRHFANDDNDDNSNTPSIDYIVIQTHPPINLAN